MSVSASECVHRRDPSRRMLPCTVAASNIGTAVSSEQSPRWPDPFPHCEADQHEPMIYRRTRYVPIATQFHLVAVVYTYSGHWPVHVQQYKRYYSYSCEQDGWWSWSPTRHLTEKKSHSISPG